MQTRVRFYGTTHHNDIIAKHIHARWLGFVTLLEMLGKFNEDGNEQPFNTRT